LKNGFTDVKAMLENEIIDFVNVDIKTSLTDANLPFSTVASWWGDVCQKANKPFYITHCGENVDKKVAGYEGTDQLARQLSTVVKMPNYYGSSFSGLSSLVKNLKTSTDILLKKYANDYDDKDLWQGIEMISPIKSNFVTYEDQVQFKGKYDPKQELKINGKPIVPTEIGGFSEWIKLNVGNNKITVEHKGIAKEYNINRKVIIFQSVSPTASMTVTGSSTIGLKVLAYRGSNITATINGKTVKLVQGGGADENEAESLYVGYEGTYTVPPASKKNQNIGSIKFKGNYQGAYQSKTGATITIEKLPDEISPDGATGKTYKMATVNTRYADTFPYNTTGFPEPITYQLIKGTEDIVVGQNGNYLNLRSGITIKKSEATVSQKVFKGNNSISNMNIGVEGNDTVIRATMAWKSPFSLNLSPYAYYNSPSDKTHMGSENFFFKADKVTLLLDYATFNGKNVSGNFNNSPIFSGIKMEQVKNEKFKTTQYKLTLPLRKVGKYYGCHAQWEGNTLVLKFNHAPKQGTLNGVRIAVDPGHGGVGAKGTGTGPGNTAGKDINEAPLNLLYANQLATVLRAKGADVVMMRNGNETISVQGRVERAEANNCDLYISVHQNSAGSATKPHGVQTYYNAPFSQPLAKFVQGELEKVPGAGGSRWNKWHGNDPDYGFVVTRERQFPSVLVECGFMSNRSDEMLGLNPAYRAKMVNAMAN
ncbi:MAG: N-acetylmuramoyl-L-alanine amidase, partial [Oscillospiraceae bacterium]